MKSAPAFSVARSLARARNALREPPPLERIKRPEFAGVLVAEFALPLELCKPTNRTRGAESWAQLQTKDKIRALMATQARMQLGRVIQLAPLPGRPQVLAVRFSSSDPDKYADWAKAAIDVLCAPDERARERLNLIKDDRPAAADVHQWREPAPKSDGFVYIQVRTGAETMARKGLFPTPAASDAKRWRRLAVIK